MSSVFLTIFFYKKLVKKSQVKWCNFVAVKIVGFDWLAVGIGCAKVFAGFDPRNGRKDFL